MILKYKKKHPPAWFKKGKVICAGEANLFVGSTIIQSEDHGKALYAMQDKGYRYKQIN